MKVPCYLNPTGSNHYATPIEGLFAIVDLLRSEATGVVDEGVVPIPQDDRTSRWRFVTLESPSRRARPGFSSPPRS